MSSVRADRVDVEVTELRNTVTVSEDALTAYVSLIGAQGPPGSSIITGSGDPTISDGVEGDIYIDTTNPPAFWGPKEADGWPASAFFVFASNRRFEFEQTSPATQWTVIHDLGGFPAVSVVDSAKTQVIGEVTYIDDETVQIEFEQPFSGYAYLT